MSPKLLLASLVAFTPLAHAEKVIPDECRVSPQPAEEVIPSDQVSGDYWTNVMGDHIVTFTNTGGLSGMYQAYDLKNKKPIRLTHEMDPFPAPDGRHMYIHPKPVTFYNFDEVRDKIENKGAIFKNFYRNDQSAPKGIYENKDPTRAARFVDRSPGIDGYYESLAALKTSRAPGNNYSTYRVLTGQNEGTMKDYKVTFGKNDEILNVSASSNVVTLCPNLRDKNFGLDFDTPIISPKGDEFAVTKRGTQSTVIVKFNPKSGACNIVLDLGYPTGKVHFSPDGSKIAFDATKLGGSIVPKPYLLDRKTGELKSLEVGNPIDNAQGTYPAFLPNGKIVYQRTANDPKTGRTQRDWVIVDPSKFNSIKMRTITATDSCPSMLVDPRLSHLQHLWEDVCVNGKTKNNGLLWALTVDPAKCKSFVEKNAYIEKLTKADIAVLVAACPTKKAPTAGAAFTKHSVAQTYPRVIQSRCTICHVQGSPHGYIPFDDPEAMRKMKAIGDSAKSGQPYYGKTFLEQITDILAKNAAGKTPPKGVPTVPADGERLNNSQIAEIAKWVKDGQKGKYKP